MPKLREWQFIVYIKLEENMPPGDECEAIREALSRNGFDVTDIAWVSQTPVSGR